MGSNNPNNRAEVIDQIKQADIIIDQMLVGFYGVFCVESMALGKPVICYMRDNIWDEMKGYCPAVNANPDNLYLRIEELILNHTNLGELGKRSRKYVEEYHDSTVISKKILDWFSAKSI